MLQVRHTLLVRMHRRRTENQLPARSESIKTTRVKLSLRRSKSVQKKRPSWCQVIKVSPSCPAAGAGLQLGGGEQRGVTGGAWAGRPRLEPPGEECGPQGARGGGPGGRGAPQPGYNLHLLERAQPGGESATGCPPGSG